MIYLLWLFTICISDDVVNAKIVEYHAKQAMCSSRHHLLASSPHPLVHLQLRLQWLTADYNQLKVKYNIQHYFNVHDNFSIVTLFLLPSIFNGISSTSLHLFIFNL